MSRISEVFPDLNAPAPRASGTWRSPRPSQQWRLSLQSLEARDQPSAAPLDLTTAGAAGTVNGAIFRQDNSAPGGTGVFQPFVRIQGAAAGTPVQQGFNTDARPLQFNETKSANFTHALRLSDVPREVDNGVAYRVFRLDINQKSSQPYLSLDQLRLYVADAPNLTGYDTTTGKLAGLAPVWDLDAHGVDSWIKLDARLKPGSGSGDMMVLVPEALFGEAGANPYVYLYSRFGEHYTGNAGFQEWNVIRARGPSQPPPTPPPPQTPPPAPVTSSLSGHVFVDMNADGAQQGGEVGISGVTIYLTGTDIGGNAVSLQVETDEFGFYSFDGLAAGTYQLSRDPSGGRLLDVSAAAGSQGGTVADNDHIVSIVLGAGAAGTDYNFGTVTMA